MKSVVNGPVSLSTNAQVRASVDGFVDLFRDYMKDAPTEASRFSRAWEDGNLKVIKSIVNDVLDGLDTTDDNHGAVDGRGRP